MQTIELQNFVNNLCADDYSKLCNVHYKLLTIIDNNTDIIAIKAEEIAIIVIHH